MITPDAYFRFFVLAAAMIFAAVAAVILYFVIGWHLHKRSRRHERL